MMNREVKGDAHPNPVGPIFNSCGMPLPVKQSNWHTRALAAAAELAAICKAKSRYRTSKRWVIYRLAVCPITGELYPDPDPFAEAPRIAVSPDGALIFIMPHRQGDQMHELLIKLRAAGHQLPKWRIMKIHTMSVGSIMFQMMVMAEMAQPTPVARRLKPSDPPGSGPHLVH